MLAHGKVELSGRVKSLTLELLNRYGSNISATLIFSRITPGRPLLLAIACLFYTVHPTLGLLRLWPLLWRWKVVVLIEEMVWIHSAHVGCLAGERRGGENTARAERSRS